MDFKSVFPKVQTSAENGSEHISEMEFEQPLTQALKSRLQV